MLYDTDHDKGDWLHEVARDKLLDEAECEICVHYRVNYWPVGGVERVCALRRRLEPCREFLREIGSEG